MAAETTAVRLEVAGVERRHLVRSKVLADYWALTKPEVNFLIAITTFAGFCLARPTHSHPFPFMLLIGTLLGTLLVAAGTATLRLRLHPARPGATVTFVSSAIAHLVKKPVW
jgi:heme O synthase-like polyprenyltransferase